MTASKTGKSFDALYANFTTTKYWADMERTYENSPWHREASVAVHTDMLLDWYENNIKSRNEKQKMLTQVACLFHDVGKPPSEEQKYSEERGNYRSYHGHELVSARMWTDFAMGNRQVVEKWTGFTLMDIANVALMVEHHVPFGLKDKQKRRALKNAFMLRMGRDGHQAWLDLLMSDQHGRISDDQDKKLADVAEWMQEWEQV